MASASTANYLDIRSIYVHKLARPACLWALACQWLVDVGLPLLLTFITVPLETNYLRMYWINFHPIFRIGTHVGGHDHSNLLFAIAQKTLLW